MAAKAEGSTALSVITPAMSAFINKTDHLNTKLVDNISGYKSVIDDSAALINDVMSFDVDGSRGKLANLLKSFAVNGTWSVYGQQYDNKKIPIVLQEGPLQKVTWTRKKIQKMLTHSDGRFTDEMDDIVKRFEIAMMADVNSITSEEVGNVDFHAAWKSARMSAETLNDDAHRYHDTWVFFFSDVTKKAIPKLVVNIDEALVFYHRNVTIQRKLGKSNDVTNRVMIESDKLRSSSIDFLRREGEIKLLKFAGEQAGDTEENVSKFADAEKLNVERFDTDTAMPDVDAPSTTAPSTLKTPAQVSADIMCIDLSDDEDEDDGDDGDSGDSEDSEDSDSDFEDVLSGSVVRASPTGGKCLMKRTRADDVEVAEKRVKSNPDVDDFAPAPVPAPMIDDIPIAPALIAV